MIGASLSPRTKTFLPRKTNVAGLMRRLRDDKAGTTAVEFGLLALPFIVLIFGCLQFGMIAWTESGMQYAVEQAARCATVNTTLCGTPSQIQQYAASQMTSTAVVAADFTYVSTGCGNQVSVTINYPYMVQVFLPASITLTAKSCHPV